MLWLLRMLRYLAMFLDGSNTSCRSPNSFSYLLGNFSHELRSRATGAKFRPLWDTRVYIRRQRRERRKLARYQSPTVRYTEKNAVIPTVKTLPSYIMSSVSVAGQLPVCNNAPPFWKAHYCFFGLIFYSYLSPLVSLCLSNDQSISNHFPSYSTAYGKGKKNPHPSFPVSCE